MENERGFVVCKNGRLVKGPEVEGTSHSVKVPIRCPPGSKPRALVHTHPGGNPNLSDQDKREARRINLPVCTKTRQFRYRCFKVRK